MHKKWERRKEKGIIFEQKIGKTHTKLYFLEYKMRLVNKSNNEGNY